MKTDAARLRRVAVSAGIRGTQIVLAPADYLRATGGQVGSIARPKD